VQYQADAGPIADLQAHVERVIQTIKHEVLNAFCIVTNGHLDGILRTTQTWRNERRGHSSRDHLPPIRDEAVTVPINFSARTQSFAIWNLMDTCCRTVTLPDRSRDDAGEQLQCRRTELATNARHFETSKKNPQPVALVFRSGVFLFCRCTLRRPSHPIDSV